MADDRIIVSIAYYAQGAAPPVWAEARAGSADPAHAMTGLLDASGVKVLTAGYDPATGRLASLTDTDQRSAPVTTGGFDGAQAGQGVTDAAGHATADVYDAHGDVTRQVRTVTDAAGNVTGYQVAASDYGYWSGYDAWDANTVGATNDNRLERARTYAPILGPAAAAARPKIASWPGSCGG